MQNKFLGGFVFKFSIKLKKPTILLDTYFLGLLENILPQHLQQNDKYNRIYYY